MRVATFNVENLFSRPVALNFENWEDGKPVLAAHSEFNQIVGQAAYSADDKAALLKILNAWGLTSAHANSKYFYLRDIRGDFARYQGGKAVSIQANGRNDWIGWLDLKARGIRCSGDPQYRPGDRRRRPRRAAAGGGRGPGHAAALLRPDDLAAAASEGEQPPPDLHAGRRQRPARHRHRADPPATRWSGCARTCTAGPPRAAPSFRAMRSSSTSTSASGTSSRSWATTSRARRATRPAAVGGCRRRRWRRS
ncbi:MAG: hypothetical protein MZW92_31550 [Comamonadaceae bacterium]|nr:hypothetical protein [Comamonadaceae bacterium]